FALALMADKLGHTPDRDELLGRAKGWSNLFEPGMKFLEPLTRDRKFPSGYHPEFPDGYREGTGWQYLWLVPHDVAALRAAMDEDAPGTFASRLDQFMAEPAAEAVPG